MSTPTRSVPPAPRRGAGGTARAARRPRIDEVVDFLARTDSYPWPAATVEVVETHMSWLFLAGSRVCKLKKPERRNGFDHRSARKRRLACQRELKLNRRLAPDVYLRLLTLRRNAHGQLSLEGPGRAVDTLVCMRRLSVNDTLEVRLQRGRLTERDARRVVRRLVAFWRLAPSVSAGSDYRRRLGGAAAWALAGLRRPAYGLDADLVEAVADALRAAARECAATLAQRARQGRIVDGHGDLRPEHIYFERVPQVIDCIEFSRELRCHDPLYELAFLAMECDRAGHREVDAWLFAAFSRCTGEVAPRALVEFYKAHNAFKRARIAAWHLDEKGYGPRRHWIARAHAYLRLARGYLRLV